MSPVATPAAANDELRQAFAALAAYNSGSGRGALKPIDEAAARAVGDATFRAELELMLIAVLSGNAPAVAKEYACSKLAMVGGPQAAPALALLLAHPELTSAAANALQAITAPEASTALRESLVQLSGLALAGALSALGMRRDAASVSAIARRLTSPEPVVAAAAVAALGEIGDREAGAALRGFLPEAPVVLRPALDDACLACAGRLKSEGAVQAASKLLDALLASHPPPHVRAAALRLG